MASPVRILDDNLYGAVASHLRRTGQPDSLAAVESYVAESVRRNLDGRKEIQVVMVEHSAAIWQYRADDLYLTARDLGNGSITIDIGIDGGHAEEPSFEIVLPEPVARSLHEWLAP